jgi:hypothetical protein
MNKEILEDTWILPKINKILGAVPLKIETVNEKIELLAVFFETIRTVEISTLGGKSNNLNIGYDFNKNASFMYFLIDKYNRPLAKVAENFTITETFITV